MDKNILPLLSTNNTRIYFYAGSHHTCDQRHAEIFLMPCMTFDSRSIAKQKRFELHDSKTSLQMSCWVGQWDNEQMNSKNFRRRATITCCPSHGFK